MFETEKLKHALKQIMKQLNVSVEIPRLAACLFFRSIALSFKALLEPLFSLLGKLLISVDMALLFTAVLFFWKREGIKEESEGE